MKPIGLKKKSPTKNEKKETIKPKRHIEREERKELQAELRRLTRETEQAEKKLPKLEAKIEAIDAVLGDPATYDTKSPEAIQKLNDEKLQLETEQASLEEAWLLGSARIEELSELLA